MTVSGKWRGGVGGAEVYVYIKFFHAKKNVLLKSCVLVICLRLHSSPFASSPTAECFPLPVQISMEWCRVLCAQHYSLKITPLDNQREKRELQGI